MCKADVYHCFVLGLEEDLWRFYSQRWSHNGWLCGIYSFWVSFPMRNWVIDPRVVTLSGNHRCCMVNTLLRDHLTQICAKLKLTESSGRMLSGLLVPVCSFGSHLKRAVLPCLILSAKNQSLAVHLLFIVLLKSRCSVSFVSVFHMGWQRGLVFLWAFISLLFAEAIGSKWPRSLQLLIFCIFSSSVASAPYLSCWHIMKHHVLVCSRAYYLPSEKLPLADLGFPFMVLSLLFQDKCIVGTWEENIFS